MDLIVANVEALSRLAVALGIGLLVGIERGWRSREMEPHGRAAGLRTFGLSGLMGGVSGLLSLRLDPWIAGYAFLAFSAAFGAFSWLEARAQRTVSVTTLIAGMLTFLLGVMATVGDVSVTVAAAVGMTVLLALRSQLHSWLSGMTWEELRAGLVLMAMSFLLLPVLPNRPVDPWGAVNLHEVWLLAIMTALISLAGYVAVRLFGDRLGIIVTAAAGGLSSSTATTLTFARLCRAHPVSVNLLAGGILISGAVMTLRVAAIGSVLNPGLAGTIGATLGAAAAVLIVAALAFVFGADRAPAGEPRPALRISNPLELATSLRLSALIILVMLAVELVRRAWGQAGVLAVAALSGIADVDAITLSIARMDTPAQLAAQAILLAVTANTLSKAVLAAWVGGRGVGLRVALASILAIAVAGSVYLWQARERTSPGVQPGATGGIMHSAPDSVPYAAPYAVPGGPRA